MSSVEHTALNDRKWPEATGRAVWKRKDIEQEKPFTLAPVHVAELLALARRADIAPEYTPASTLATMLPSLKPLVDEVRDEIANGRGIALVKGFPVAELSDHQCASGFWAMSTLLGRGLAQSSAGDLVGFVSDRGESRLNNRGYQSRAALAFHVDLSDVAGLLCVRAAAAGGESLAASSLAIYNEMRVKAPEYLDVLARGFHWSRNGEHAPSEASYGPRIPVFISVGGVVSCRYNRSMIRRGSEEAGEPLTPLQERALAFVEETARRPEFHIGQYMAPGDIQFFNNYTVLHSRSDFENATDPAKARLMLRVWLHIDGMRLLGSNSALMRDGPLVYGLQGRTAEELRAVREALR
ncbi:MAG TPA: TauD/TfdA family dioxygenase [Ramlibacter sp.]|uniref:TauD/TfdA family dioxygenase n=1 Tax=Ramlibacter sp. TaxID=1917967 RepID=UPI002CD3C568|nr:TauD/TfdA family dioxygenase [Ramlibacter sp.]HVZ45495.1 TauD/TfdA family dioxygenase [Ramlibacter sp.]